MISIFPDRNSNCRQPKVTKRRQESYFRAQEAVKDYSGLKFFKLSAPFQNIAELLKMIHQKDITAKWTRKTACAPAETFSNYQDE